MDEQKVRDLVAQLSVEVNKPVAVPPGPPGPTPPDPMRITVGPGESLQVAVDRAPAGATIEVQPGTYQGNLTVGARPLVIRTSVPVPPGLRSKEWDPVWLMGSGPGVVNVIPGAPVVLEGLGVASTNPSGTLIADRGVGTVLDRVLALGDVSAGQHRGIEANGVSGRYVQCCVDECGLVGRDAQAVMGWDGTKDLLMDRCYFGGAAQSVMFGGADSRSADTVPTNIRIEKCILGKSVAWYKRGWQIKTSLELKCAVGVTVIDSELYYAGVSAGQAGYLIVLTPRNEGGKAPWSQVVGVTIERCRCEHGGGGVLMLGTGDVNPSGPLSGVQIRNTAFLDLDPRSLVWTGFPDHPGAGRLVTVSKAPKSVVLEHITYEGQNLSAILYLTLPCPPGFTMRNVVGPETKYGYKIDGGGSGIPAMLTACGGAKPNPMVLEPGPVTGAAGYPGA